MKKIICVLLCLAMAFTCFAGCSAKNSAKKKKKNTKKSTSSSASASSENTSSDSIVSDDDTGSTVEPGVLDPEAPIDDETEYLQLSVLNGQTPITKNYRGHSATIYHAFGFMEDESSGRVYTEKMRNDELKKLTNFGIRYARTRYPSDWTWDANRGWDFSRNRFGYFCNYAKALQQRGVQVVLQAGWHLGAITEIESCSIGEVEYLKGRGADRYAESYGLDFTGKSAEEQRMIKGARRYGYWLGQTLLQLRSRGIYNVNYISYFVEPSNFYSGHPAGNSNKEYV